MRISLADARNSIWNMRSQVLEAGDLASALMDILQQILQRHRRGRADAREKARHPRRLPPVTENNLLRIGQEAVTNAMSPARAKLIEMELDFVDKEVRLRVMDDGRGFDTARIHPPAKASFGLMGMP